jgi:uncharacterized protein (UPF0332 family)
LDEPVDLTNPKIWLELAENKLDHARQIFEIGLYDDAVSRAYYAMFYAARAALLTKGLDIRKHSSTAAKFSELFVATGDVEREYVRYLSQAQGARELSDYAPFVKTSREGALEILEAAEAFIFRVKELIG